MKDWVVKMWTAGFILVFALIPVAMVDDIWIRPIASERANEYCIAHGFDQYKSYSRIGFLSTEPIAIKCEYAERYTDLGVRTTESG